VGVGFLSQDELVLTRGKEKQLAVGRISQSFSGFGGGQVKKCLAADVSKPYVLV